MGQPYPIEITQDVLLKHKGISDAEIEKDILDTNVEIHQLQKMYEAEKILAQHHIDVNQRKIYQLKYTSRLGMIHERQDFNEYLRRVLKARRETGAGPNG